jgi:hypothetical protein
LSYARFDPHPLEIVLIEQTQLFPLLPSKKRTGQAARERAKRLSRIVRLVIRVRVNLPEDMQKVL